MSVKWEKEENGEYALVFAGFEQGIAPSPHKGIANLQSTNISTEAGEILCAYSRVQQSQIAQTTGTLTASAGAGSFFLSSSVTLQVGTWITLSASGISGLSTSTPYYVDVKNNGLYQLSSYYDPSQSNGISHGTSGTATFSTTPNMGEPIDSATEIFSDGTNVQYRYYILDSNGLVWVYDTLVFANSLFTTGVGTTWFLPDASTTYFQTGYSTVLPSGLCVLNGWLLVFGGHQIWGKPTVNLGDTTSNTTTYASVVQGTSATTAITATSTIAMGATSATLTTSWTGPTGTYTVTFSDGDTRAIVLTNSATGISWTTGLTAMSTSALVVTGSFSSDPVSMSSALGSLTPHAAFVGHQGKAYYCDANYIGEIFPDTSVLVTGLPNVQSFCSYTGSGTSGTIATVISGSLPSNGYAGDNSNFLRVPAIFFPSQGGTNPTALAQGAVYFIACQPGTGAFAVYLTASGGSPLNLSSGAVGTQYFNTFYPTSGIATYATTGTATITTQRVNLPEFETSQCIVEVGNTVIFGCNGNTMYPWNQLDATPSDLIALPENNVKRMVNVNNMVYILAGFKGNIYITNNSVASLVLSVPDYCAGIPGTPNSYIEPYFAWGGLMYLRGRVYFSILDQTASKAGNCGGVWSFIPTQNLYVGQDTGISLRQENQNSYGSYSGVANVLLASQNQDATAPQYWSGWMNGYSVANSTLFGIDFTGTVPNTIAYVETDLVGSGTLLQKQSFKQVEYKLATPLASGDSVQLYYRLNGTDAYTTCGNVVLETTNPLSGYFVATFQNTQWVQIMAQLTPNGSSSSSFIRLLEIRVR